MDVTVTPKGGNSWELSDLLGRSMGRIVEWPVKGPFTIQPAGGALETMKGVKYGPHTSVDAALAEIEKCTRGVCRHCAEESSDRH